MIFLPPLSFYISDTGCIVIFLIFIIFLISYISYLSCISALFLRFPKHTSLKADIGHNKIDGVDPHK